jgi:hypothetical protein
MGIVNGQYLIGEPCACALFKHQQSRTERPASAPEFFLIQLGHRVMNVEEYLAPKQPGWKRTQHGGVGDAADDYQIVGLPRGKARGDPRGRREEAQIAKDITATAATPVARCVYGYYIDSTRLNGLPGIETDQIDCVSTLDKRLCMTLYAAVTDIRGVCNHQHPSHA